MNALTARFLSLNFCRFLFGLGLMAVICTSLEGQSFADAPATASFVRLGNQEWEGSEKDEPPHVFLTNEAPKTPFWEHIWKSDEFKRFKTKHLTLVFHQLRIKKNNKFDAIIRVYDSTQQKEEYVTMANLPMELVLMNLKKEEHTDREPILPFPLRIYNDGANFPSYYVDGSNKEKLEAVAEFLGVGLTTPAWAPRSPVYDKIGDHPLEQIEITDWEMSIYGELKITFRPTYGAYDLWAEHHDGRRVQQLHVDAPKAEVKIHYFSYFPDKNGPGFALDPRRPLVFKEIVTAFNANLGVLAPRISKGCARAIKQAGPKKKSP